MYSKDRSILLDRREMLRVKLKSLAAESKMIRREELKTFGLLREQLWQHRIKAVRNEARSTNIAYALVRGMPLERIEHHSETSPNWRSVRAMLRKYGPAGMQHLPDTAKPVVLDAERPKLAA